MYVPYGQVQAIHEERINNYLRLAERRRLIAEARRHSHRLVTFRPSGRTNPAIDARAA